MQYGHCRRGLLEGTASMMFFFAWVLMGCGNDSDKAVISGGAVGLAAADGATLAGLTFDFPDATTFGFPGASVTLALGDAASTFTLTTSGGTVIHGAITTGASAAVSCRLTQNLQEVEAGKVPFEEEYDTCQATVDSKGEIAFGASGAGTVTLSFGRTGATAVASDPQDVILHLHDDGTVTINNNATPI